MDDNNIFDRSPWISKLYPPNIGGESSSEEKDKEKYL
jgi:hypothetical protein